MSFRFTNILKAINTLSHKCIGGKKWYVTYLYPLGWPRSLLKGSDDNQFLGMKMGKNLRHFCRAWMYYLNVWLEKGGMSPNYAPWCGLEAYQRGVTLTNYCWCKWDKNLKSICLEGQSHIFIFSGSTCHAEGSCVQWTVFFLSCEPNMAG